jgi:hypothetical protein
VIANFAASTSFGDYWSYLTHHPRLRSVHSAVTLQARRRWWCQRPADTPQSPKLHAGYLNPSDYNRASRARFRSGPNGQRNVSGLLCKRYPTTLLKLVAAFDQKVARLNIVTYNLAFLQQFADKIDGIVRIRKKARRLKLASEVCSFDGPTTRPQNSFCR